MTLADVDGFATAAGDFGEGGQTMSLIEVAEYLGITPRYLDGTDIGGAGPVAHVGHAAAAIRDGRADVVLITYASTLASGATNLGTAVANSGLDGPGQFEVPYGFSLVASYALAAQRHMHEFGTTEEALAEVAVTCRAHAAANPDARYRDPITLDDVLNSPTIASPLHRLDCCVVTDGGGAVVLTSRARARDCDVVPIAVLGFGETCVQIQMNQVPDLVRTGARTSGAAAFDQAGLAPADVDVAQLYDSFTITVLLALEDLGFCPKGQAGDFVTEAGIGVGGTLPINTDGGGLSSNHPGRRGIFTVIEAVRQLRGEGPGAQVPDAKIALSHGSGGSLSSAATLLMGV